MRPSHRNFGLVASVAVLAAALLVTAPVAAQEAPEEPVTDDQDFSIYVENLRDVEPPSTTTTTVAVVEVEGTQVDAPDGGPSESAGEAGPLPTTGLSHMMLWLVLAGIVLIQVGLITVVATRPARSRRP